jgi:hypothetical protein
MVVWRRRRGGGRGGRRKGRTEEGEKGGGEEGGEGGGRSVDEVEEGPLVTRTRAASYTPLPPPHLLSLPGAGMVGNGSCALTVLESFACTLTAACNRYSCFRLSLLPQTDSSPPQLRLMNHQQLQANVDRLQAAAAEGRGHGRVLDGMLSQLAREKRSAERGERGVAAAVFALGDTVAPAIETYAPRAVGRQKFHPTRAVAVRLEAQQGDKNGLPLETHWRKLAMDDEERAALVNDDSAWVLFQVVIDQSQPNFKQGSDRSLRYRFRVCVSSFRLLRLCCLMTCLYLYLSLFIGTLIAPC